jgi:hypothetical protein
MPGAEEERRWRRQAEKDELDDVAGVKKQACRTVTAKASVSSCRAGGSEGRSVGNDRMCIKSPPPWIGTVCVFDQVLPHLSSYSSHFFFIFSSATPGVCG